MGTQRRRQKRRGQPIEYRASDDATPRTNPRKERDSMLPRQGEGFLLFLLCCMVWRRSRGYLKRGRSIGHPEETVSSFSRPPPSPRSGPLCGLALFILPPPLILHKIHRLYGGMLQYNGESTKNAQGAIFRKKVCYVYLQRNSHFEMLLFPENKKEFSFSLPRPIAA